MRHQALADAIAQNRHIYPFHMPGHKRNPAFMPSDIGMLDVTENSAFDNLREPTGALADLHMLAAKTYGSDCAYLSVNGASGAIIAAIWALAAGKSVAIARNCHMSVWSGLCVAGAVPVWLEPQTRADTYFAGGVNPAAVETAIKDRGVAAVVITSPTYEGIVSDIASIAKACRENGASLIVDEAHGAHFPFSDAFPEPAIRIGADVSVVSLHKTLPAPGQTALLLAKQEKSGAVKTALQMLQTSSPSYVLMAWADSCLRRLKNQEIFNNYVITLKEFRAKFSGMQEAVRLLEPGVCAFDISKLVFNINRNGFRAADELEQKHKIAVEAAGPSHITALTSCADTREGLEMLYRAIGDISSRFEPAPKMPSPDLYRAPKVAVPPRDAAFAEFENVPLAGSLGRVSAGFVIPYPPGCPILCPGELIDDNVIETILWCIDNKVNIIGQPDLAACKKLICARR